MIRSAGCIYCGNVVRSSGLQEVYAEHDIDLNTNYIIIAFDT